MGIFTDHPYVIFVVGVTISASCMIKHLYHYTITIRLNAFMVVIYWCSCLILIFFYPAHDMHIIFKDYQGKFGVVL